MNIPSILQAGDTSSWHDAPLNIDGVRYDSTGYTLTHIIAGPTQPLTIVASSDGAGWVTRLSLVDADKLVAGIYTWQAFLTSADTRITVGNGQLTVKANLSKVGQGYDGRSVAEKALADAEAALANYRATGGKIKSYTIGMRAMTFMDSSSILQEINYWKTRVSHEKAQQRIANGLGNPRNLQVRFK